VRSPSDQERSSLCGRRGGSDGRWLSQTIEVDVQDRGRDVFRPDGFGRIGHGHRASQATFQHIEDGLQQERRILTTDPLLPLQRGPASGGRWPKRFRRRWLKAHGRMGGGASRQTRRGFAQMRPATQQTAARANRGSFCLSRRDDLRQGACELQRPRQPAIHSRRFSEGFGVPNHLIRLSTLCSTRRGKSFERDETDRRGYLVCCIQGKVRGRAPRPTKAHVLDTEGPSGVSRSSPSPSRRVGRYPLGGRRTHDAGNCRGSAPFPRTRCTSSRSGRPVEFVRRFDREPTDGSGM